ncbi:MAG: hypothetical protein ACF8XB_19250 [Planctomycetota bacterium JB042]
MKPRRTSSRAVRTLVPLGLFSALLMPIGCESIGDFFDDAGDAAEEVADETGDAIEDAADEVD